MQRRHVLGLTWAVEMHRSHMAAPAWGHLLAKLGVREANNSCSSHSRVQLQAALHLRCVHRLAAGPNGVFAPPHEPQPTVFTNVACGHMRYLATQQLDWTLREMCLGISNRCSDGCLLQQK